MIENKDLIYKQVKAAGLALYIPIVMVSAPLAGHFTGEYLKERFNTGSFVSLVCIAVGFMVSLVETIRIIRLIGKISKD